MFCNQQFGFLPYVVPTLLDSTTMPAHAAALSQSSISTLPTPDFQM